MTLEEEGNTLRSEIHIAAQLIAASPNSIQAKSKYIDAMDAYNEFLDRSIVAINQAQRAIMEMELS